MELRSTIGNGNAGALSMAPKTDNTENSIYFHASSIGTAYTTGATGSWIIGNNIAATSGNVFSVYNPSVQNHQLKLNIDGSSIFNYGVTAVGLLTAGNGVISNLNSTLVTAEKGDFTTVGGYNSFDPTICPITIRSAGRPFYFNRRTSLDSTANCLDFLSWNQSNPYTHIMTLGYAMNRVGIAGITSPAYTLEVGGNGRFNTDLGVIKKSHCVWGSSEPFNKFNRR